MRRFDRVLVCALLFVAGCGAEAPTAPNAELLSEDSGAGGASATTARWSRVRYNVTGTASLSVTGDTARLVLSSDFSIEQTPGPVLYVNTTNNANTGRPLRIGALRSRQGAQVYVFRIPPNVDYRYILIWCDPFNVPMAEAVLP